MRRIAAAALAALALAACSHKSPQPGETSPPPLMIDDRGYTMPLEDAVKKISYRPWIPPRTILRYAVIPPLGNLDTPENRGIAVEYQTGDRLMLISEWPKQNFALLFLRNTDITLTPCTIAHYKADGVAWTTKGNLAMTLQPDGNVSPKDVETEAKRLLAAGGCR
jgi:hypothetical protein